MKKDFMFLSESVTEGHPDKLCDQISDAIVDRFLQHDPLARIRAECAAACSIVYIAARFASPAMVDITHLARQVIDQVGYRDSTFSSRTCSIITSIQEEPQNATQRFDENSLDDAELNRITAQDQAAVFGFACRQTAAFLPLPIWLAHRLARRLSAVRFQKLLPYLAPDGKTQVGIEFRERRPYRIHSITLLTSHHGSAPVPDKLAADLRETVIAPVFQDELLRPDERTRIYINPNGPVLDGGPALHAGLTGRKTAVDTYGEYSRNSGNALSGKDPLRIDRIGTYAARYAAKNLVAGGLADECEVQLSYTIGLAAPASVQVETFGTGRLDDEDLARLVQEVFDFRPAAILRRFNLRRLPQALPGGFYRKLAAYGQIGRMDMGLPWERTDLAPALRHMTNS
jgi:S-adenosylmethionine synthetase|nr:methionine adenosyltransferase [Desulfuromonas sp. CSMB_57]